MFWIQLDTSPLPQNYSECSTDVISRITEYDTLKDNLAYNVIPLLTIILSCVSIVINLVFCYLVIFALRSHMLPFRGYSLMLNRSFTDLFVSISTVVFIALHKTIKSDEPDTKELTNSKYEIEYLIPHGRTLFTLLLTLDYWAVAGAYGVLALLPFLAVKYPWLYRSYITNRRTVIIMIGVWLVGAIYSTLVVSLSSNNAFNIFNGRTDLIQWTVSTEDYVLSISNLIILVLAFILVTSSYTATIFFLWRKSKGKGPGGVHFTSIKRMFLNIAAFAATCLVMASFVGLPLFLSSHIHRLSQINIESKCKEALYAFKLGYQITCWATFTMAAWILRMSFDPVSTFVLDDRFKKVINRAIVPCLGEAVDKSNLPSGRSTNSPPSPTKTNDQTSMISFIHKCSDMNLTPSSVSGQYFKYRTPTFIEPASSKRKNHIRFDDLVI